MTKRMLIDSTHAEETRVVVLENNRLEDFDVETSTKKQLKGNIYLAKIVRVEPSLQAAFVEFGGGRHGFLAFGEIHPDYYQIPVADRRRLMEMQEAEAREDEEAEEREAARAAHGTSQGSERGGRERGRRGRGRSSRDQETDAHEAENHPGDHPESDEAPAPEFAEAAEPHDSAPPAHDEPGAADALTQAAYAIQADPEAAAEAEPRVAQAAAIAQDIVIAPEEAQTLFAEPESATPLETLEQPEGADLAPEAAEPAIASDAAAPTADAGPGTVETLEEQAPPPESVGGDHDDDAEREERSERRDTPRFLRNYKIQEVIRRRQILLVQVVKEERGTKGAALTTYISLAGRFSVLMPNSPRGGGISRKITSATDRRRLKEVMTELDLPRGMGLIVRTAGANRPKPEILRDGEYLLNQWDQIRELTMKSMAPALIYEEASLIKRAIRDVYSRDVDDILVDGEEGWRAAHDFMRMLMPTHAKKVQLWKDSTPLFAKAQVESQLDAMLQPTVQLRSGGYLVINQTEALVAIDVNSGRSTRERGIEETAVRTNLEAAEETARQLRLRDLAGLIVIDFIDMESRRNNIAVEKRLKDALRFDRARIQVGSISHFGLMEMSRQRLRPSLTETTFVACPHCAGTGHVRSTESAALHVLRGIEEEGSKRRAAEIVVHVAGSIAFYILNHKRVRLAEVEERFGLIVTFRPDESLLPPDMRIERVRAQLAAEAPMPISQLAPPEPFEDPDEETEAPPPIAAIAAAAAEEAPAEEEATSAPAEPGEDTDARGRKRRRRRRGGRREDGTAEAAADGEAEPAAESLSEPPLEAAAAEPAPTESATPESATSEPAATEQAATEQVATQATTPQDPVNAIEAPAEDADAPDDEAAAPTATEEGERKRRGRRGGRRRRRSDAAPEPGAPASSPVSAPVSAPAAPPAPPPAYKAPSYNPPPYTPPAYNPPSYSPPVYSGPTPADPFGTNAFSFFDAVEQEHEQPPRAPAPAAPASRGPAPTPAPRAPARPPAPRPAAQQPPPVVVGPAIVPVVIGESDTPPAEKKRGWWKR